MKNFIIRIMCENAKVFDVHLLKHIRFVYFEKLPLESILTLKRKRPSVFFSFIQLIQSFFFSTTLHCGSPFLFFFFKFFVFSLAKEKGKSMTFAFEDDIGSIC